MYSTYIGIRTSVRGVSHAWCFVGRGFTCRSENFTRVIFCRAEYYPGGILCILYRPKLYSLFNFPSQPLLTQSSA
ncbi:hypothetical protein Y032_0295g1664 [Ancylostoma ceylanicum]|uniref:Uncharacterized protein n=1 Tax=Ancylostoma ceylanicum TaxID=53326 RepID=A0A016S4N2_9BILA|nr:hypothetical protein Y032_0295g1664 [Ancylostoma ceylanicum]